jgi:hypothetical protein
LTYLRHRLPVVMPSVWAPPVMTARELDERVEIAADRIGVAAYRVASPPTLEHESCCLF